MIQYSGDYIKTSKPQNNGVPQLHSSTSRDGIMKISKLNLNLARSASDKFAESLVKALAVSYGAFPQFLNCFKALKDIRTLTIEVNPSQYLRNDFRTMNYISKHGLVGTVCLRDAAALLKR